MFGLFKNKKKENDVAIIGASSSGSIIFNLTENYTKKYPNEVVIIHNEFENAADKLLIEANNIIKEAESKDINKVKRLESLGFTKTSQVVEIQPLMQKAELSKEQVELLNYYKREYPLNKFITEEQVRAICYKYNLVCGDVNRFKGFVPEKNLKEIESFKVKDNEKSLTFIEVFTYNGTYVGLFCGKDLEIRYRAGYYHIYSKSEKNFYDYSFQQNSKILSEKGEFYGIDHKNLFGLKDKGSFNIKIQNKNLQICAPVKDMDISGLELVEGYKLKEIHIPDPVVLQPVKGGYLILTKWGDEASDPILQNEINN